MAKTKSDAQPQQQQQDISFWATIKKLYNLIGRSADRSVGLIDATFDVVEKSLNLVNTEIDLVHQQQTKRLTTLGTNRKTLTDETAASL